MSKYQIPIIQCWWIIGLGFNRSTEEDAQQVGHQRELNLPCSLEDKQKSKKKKKTTAIKTKMCQNLDTILNLQKSNRISKWISEKGYTVLRFLDFLQLRQRRCL